MTDKEVIIDELSCKNCPENEKNRCKEQKERKNNIIDIHLQNIKDVAQSYGCNLSKEIENLRQALPNITRCDVVLEKQLRRKEQECEELKKEIIEGGAILTDKIRAKVFTSLQKENDRYKQALEKIKEYTIKQFCENCEDIGFTEYTCHCEHCEYYEFLDIINEVLKDE